MFPAAFAAAPPAPPKRLGLSNPGRLGGCVDAEEAALARGAVVVCGGDDVASVGVVVACGFAEVAAAGVIPEVAVAELAVAGFRPLEDAETAPAMVAGLAPLDALAVVCEDPELARAPTAGAAKRADAALSVVVGNASESRFGRGTIGASPDSSLLCIG